MFSASEIFSSEKGIVTRCLSAIFHSSPFASVPLFSSFPLPVLFHPFSLRPRTTTVADHCYAETSILEDFRLCITVSSIYYLQILTEFSELYSLCDLRVLFLSIRICPPRLQVQIRCREALGETAVHARSTRGPRNPHARASLHYYLRWIRKLRNE